MILCRRSAQIIGLRFPRKRIFSRSSMGSVSRRLKIPLNTRRGSRIFELISPRFCFLHFGGKGTEFSSSNCSKPLCHKGFPFCHYYTLMAHLRHSLAANRGEHKNRFDPTRTCNSSVYPGPVRAYHGSYAAGCRKPHVCLYSGYYRREIETLLFLHEKFNYGIITA